MFRWVESCGPSTYRVVFGAHFLSSNGLPPQFQRSYPDVYLRRLPTQESRAAVVPERSPWLKPHLMFFNLKKPLQAIQPFQRSWSFRAWPGDPEQPGWRTLLNDHELYELVFIIIQHSLCHAEQTTCGRRYWLFLTNAFDWQSMWWNANAIRTTGWSENELLIVVCWYILLRNTCVLEMCPHGRRPPRNWI